MPPSDSKLSHGHWRLALDCNLVGQAGVTAYQDTNVARSGPYFYRVGLQQ